MSFESIAYALACVILPMVWGLVVVWASNRIEARVTRDASGKRKRGKRHVSRVEYHI
jgi:hypothetical protein